jgi:hypothetical protein
VPRIQQEHVSQIQEQTWAAWRAPLVLAQRAVSPPVSLSVPPLLPLQLVLLRQQVPQEVPLSKLLVLALMVLPLPLLLVRQKVIPLVPQLLPLMPQG